MRREFVDAVEAAPRFVPPKAAAYALSEGMRARNAALDWFFYDIDALTQGEREVLVAETNAEGAIIVVHPRGTRGDIGLDKFETYEDLVAAPGRKLRQFAIAGVGSSDVGAAALARNLADRTGEPVGAIVAGYGIADLMTEALGGWFFFGAANALQQHLHDWSTTRPARREAIKATLTGMRRGAFTPEDLSLSSDFAAGFSPDTMTLLRLLTEKERAVTTILGHSKGCLSIAFALEALALLHDTRSIAKAKKARIMTLGAVVEMPPGYDNVVQIIGEIDTFGGMNSRPGKHPVRIPRAWHHLNRRLPFGMNIRNVLEVYL